jgi:hypothetical protein
VTRRPPPARPALLTMPDGLYAVVWAGSKRSVAERIVRRRKLKWSYIPGRGYVVLCRVPAPDVPGAWGRNET